MLRFRGRSRQNAFVRTPPGLRSQVRAALPRRSNRSSTLGVYKSERNLVAQFVRQLRGKFSPWGCVKVSREFDYQRGRVDVIALANDGEHLIAFEAKIHKWREALHQAYRNTCFAHSSYVLLPLRAAIRAQQYAADFIYRNVGLCYIDDGKIVVILSPQNQPPLEPWLTRKALVAVRTRGHQFDGRTRVHRPENLRKTRHAIRQARGRRNVQADLPSHRLQGHPASS